MKTDFNEITELNSFILNPANFVGEGCEVNVRKHLKGIKFAFLMLQARVYMTFENRTEAVSSEAVGNSHY